MKKTNCKILFFAILALFLATKAHAEMGAMIAPDQQDLSGIAYNPHPPVTDADKKRVAFAELVVNILLRPKEEITAQEAAPQIYDTPDKNFNLDQNCLIQNECRQKTAGLAAYQNDIFAKYGSLIEFRHAHIIPWSFEKFQNAAKTAAAKDSAPPLPPHPQMVAQNKTVEPMPGPDLKSDEYMIHVYAKFNNKVWYHLDVIVSEDAAGKMTFRRFYIFELPRGGSQMPDGVVC